MKFRDIVLRLKAICVHCLLIFLYKGCIVWFREEGYINLLIKRGLLNVSALIAKGEIREDTVSKFEEAKNK